MIQTTTPLFLHCKTPFHPGSGSNLGIVDLPVQRESHTGYPKFEASGLKGCLRESYHQANGVDEEFIFGPERDGDAHGGSVCLTDARVLLFPVKSLKGVFSYVTCPYALNRFAEEMRVAKMTFPALPEAPGDSEALVCELPPKECVLLAGDHIVLEEYTFAATKSPKLTAFAEALAGCLDDRLISAGNLKQRIAVVSDDDFTFFVKTMTETITRVRINQETGTVDTGALFTEEYVPAETLFYSLAMAGSILLPKEGKDKWKKDHPDEPDESKYLLNLLSEHIQANPIVQMGGDATIGKGLMALAFRGVA
ncbi:MAG: type III-B CRISPR module RAMP protein Cmr4 [Oscillospiraceae bacterium]|jgi:CRISPR-associated protein Cmr4|nr:type III-B CRISPR module RAMP protein Cmr4 [Oscillospiraceae bacterium]